ncbi:hypothetical protein E2C01_059946 [Portunus trituberculatus]|uniref:Uncharacterized protein n=1 Tax=Portunus trituberculatus TaxID=210409 RepID=A0A5B7H0W8_PORTR|nr:hypothetical protein [Portunus trituberculatus]
MFSASPSTRVCPWPPLVPLFGLLHIRSQT